MLEIADLIDEVIKIEGGYSNDPSDLGGETMYGITVEVARKNGYTGEMCDMPMDVARTIYRKKYWTEPQFDRVGEVNMSVARELFDTGVNMGVGKASEFLQISLNAFNRQGKDYPDIAEDGELGNASLQALHQYMARRGLRGVPTLLKALNCLQGARYIEISRARQKNEDFVFGWLENRVELGHG